MSELTIPRSYLLVKDKVNYRRKLVYTLCLKGLKQKEIAGKLRVSISTVEKDFHVLRELKVTESG